MRTAGGKSALFLVPAALAEQKTVIVVVPYTALADDLAQSAVLRYIPQKITMVTDSVADPIGGSVTA
jgi:superfamily II DNA helicase RecQ